MASIRDLFLRDGYLVCKWIFDVKDIKSCREEILNYVDKSIRTIPSNGISIVDFVGRNILPETSKLMKNKKLQNLLKNIFGGDDYRFCSHNDIGINRTVGWHKDKLNNEYVKYETIPIWSTYEGEKHEIVKVLIYMQDHSDNDNALKIATGTHLNPAITGKNCTQTNPGLGDIIIFDQRIDHCGMLQQINTPRILVSFGFGKNNAFTDNFEEGTIARQNTQNKKLIKKSLNNDINLCSKLEQLHQLKGIRINN